METAGATGQKGVASTYTFAVLLRLTTFSDEFVDMDIAHASEVTREGYTSRKHIELLMNEILQSVRS